MPEPIPKIDSTYCCFRLQAGRSRIHRWGVYADQTIPANRKVIEYTGERMSRRETKRRKEGKYLFTLDSYWTIDGSLSGSGAEFINHSCEPNLVARIIRGHVLYFSLHKIRKGEELTLDYNFDWDTETVPCRCGAKNCRGTINVK